MKKQTGFLRLTLVISVISAIIGFFWNFEWGYLDNYNFLLASVWFVAIWIAYAIVRWIIKGFGKDGE